MDELNKVQIGECELFSAIDDRIRTVEMDFEHRKFRINGHEYGKGINYIDFTADFSSKSTQPTFWHFEAGNDEKRVFAEFDSRGYVKERGIREVKRKPAPDGQTGAAIDIERIIESTSRSVTSSATAIIAQTLASFMPEEKTPSQQVKAADQASAAQDSRKEEVLECLRKFIVRVLDGRHTCDEEAKILPKIAEIYLANVNESATNAEKNVNLMVGGKTVFSERI